MEGILAYARELIEQKTYFAIEFNSISNAYFDDVYTTTFVFTYNEKMQKWNVQRDVNRKDVMTRGSFESYHLWTKQGETPRIGIEVETFIVNTKEMALGLGLFDGEWEVTIMDYLDYDRYKYYRNLWPEYYEPKESYDDVDRIDSLDGIVYYLKEEA